MTEINTEPSDSQITLLVNSFYAKVRYDPLLAPVFENHIKDWQAHQLKMMGFWRSVLLGTKEYKGHLMGVHARLPGLAPAHFSRWLELFGMAMHETLPLEAMPYTQYIAQRFGRALQLGLFGDAEQPRQQAPQFSPTTSNQQQVAPC